MTQILHIFRKDVRHHWREIIVSLLLVVAYAWRESAYLGLHQNGDSLKQVLFGLLTPLVALSWAFLIIRAAHGEPLVGNRQFWVTRPYGWRSLLLAKLLFVGTVVNLPLFILQAFLLLEAGFSPISHLAGLLWMQVLWTAFVFLPVGTLATVTSGVGQLVLVVLGILIYFIALAATVATVVPNIEGPVGSFPSAFEFTMALAAALAVVGWQYARRRTTESRTLLVGLAAAIPLTLFAFPYRTLIHRGYPEKTQPPIRIAFDPTPLKSHEGGMPGRKHVLVRIPVLVSGVAEGSVVDVPGIRVSVRVPSGQHWGSPWRCCGPTLRVGRPHADFDFSIDRVFFERVKSTPVNLVISFAVESFRATETERIVAGPSPFSVPGEGRCFFSPTSASGIACVFPFAAPYLQWSAKSNEVTCPVQPSETALPTGTVGYGWSHDRGFGLNSIYVVPMDLWDWGVQKPPESPTKICAGTPLTFRELQESQRLRGKLEIPNLRLADYELRGSGGGFGGFGVTIP
jgi:hypothetical protein